MSADIFKGNSNIRGHRSAYKYTKEELAEYMKCAEDPAYFIENYVQIIDLDRGLVNFKLYDYQKEMIDTYCNHNRIVVLTGRQQGKSVTAASFLLWWALFKDSQTIAILANKAATAREIVARITIMLENVPFFLQPGCKYLNKGSIEFSNDSRIISAATSSSSIRGMSISCVTGDTKITILDDYDRIWRINIENTNSSKYKHNTETKKKYYYVYKITNKIDGKFYIGVHGTNDLDDGYMGSGKLLIRAFEKYGAENFEKEIIKIFDNLEDASKLEEEIVNKEFVLRDDTYNLALGGCDGAARGMA